MPELLSPVLPFMLTAMREWAEVQPLSEEPIRMLAPFRFDHDGVPYTVVTNGWTVITAPGLAEGLEEMEVSERAAATLRHVLSRPPAAGRMPGPLLRSWLDPWSWAREALAGLTHAERKQLLQATERDTDRTRLIWRGVLVGVPIDRYLLHQAIALLPEETTYGVGRSEISAGGIANAPMVVVDGAGWRVTQMSRRWTPAEDEAWKSAPTLGLQGMEAAG